MKALLWVGLVVLILGIASLFIALPRTENHGVSVGNASIGVQTRHNEKIPPVASGVIIAAGVVLMIAGARK